MKATTRALVAALALLAAALIGGSRLATAAADHPAKAAAEEHPAKTAPTGDLWEVTSRMSMEGAPMALPAQTLKVCSPKEWKEPPGATDERRKCKTSDFKMEGAKATWKVVCEGMKGEGEITRNGDAYSGAIKFTSEDGVMTIKLDGRRVGDCEVKN